MNRRRNAIQFETEEMFSDHNIHYFYRQSTGVADRPQIEVTVTGGNSVIMDVIGETLVNRETHLERPRPVSNGRIDLFLHW